MDQDQQIVIDCLGVDQTAEEREKEINPASSSKIDGFYDSVRNFIINNEQSKNFRYISSRSTEENKSSIQSLCDTIKSYCEIHNISSEETQYKKSESSIKAFKYLICNTNFECQSRLAEDTVSGHLVDMQPPFSPYLLIEILWHINFENILAESILYLPLDLCVEILEILPRCINCIDYQRASKFLSTIITNSYRKLILLRDAGSQSKDINRCAKLLTGNLQDLMLQFTHERLLKFEGVSKSERYKRYGIALKTIIQMVKTCLVERSKSIELSIENEEIYKLSFGQEPVLKIENAVLQGLLTETKNALVSLLLSRVKEIDCNIYMEWTEYDDEENSSSTLQRAIGLECHHFIESTKELKDSKLQEYNHLIECLQQITSKPNFEENTKSLNLIDLLQEVQKGSTDCLISSFHRYKEWDTTVMDAIQNNISLLKRDNIEKLLEYFAIELDHSQEKLQIEKLWMYSQCLSKALDNLTITQLYEITEKFLIKFEKNSNMEEVINISNFENFITLHSNFSNAKYLRVVLFYLCLKPRSTLKVLLKMTIGHSDYPNTSVSLDDMILLLPILKIKVLSKYTFVMDTLEDQCSESTKNFFRTKSSTTGNSSQASGVRKKKKTNKHEEMSKKNVNLVVQILQVICLENSNWDATKFEDLLHLLYSFCEIPEIVNEVFIPVLVSNVCSFNYLECILLELKKLIGKYNSKISIDLIPALELHAVILLKNNSLSRYKVDELLTSIILVAKHLICEVFTSNTYESLNLNYQNVYLRFPYFRDDNINHLNDIIEKVTVNHQHRMNNLIKGSIQSFDYNIVRYLLLKCTKYQYLDYAKEIIYSNGKVFKCTSKSDSCNTIICLTLEACLLCLEYPETGFPDSISFLLKCLVQFLPSVQISKKKMKFYHGVCSSLRTNIAILKPSINHTVISEAFDNLTKQYQEANSDLKSLLTALEQFALKCSEESEKLKIFEGPHSSTAMKLWLAHDILTDLIDEKGISDNYVRKFETYSMSK